jgi:hypothetical protein
MTGLGLPTLNDHADGRLDQLQVERPALADDHVVRVVVHDGVAVVVQRGQQPALADDERRAPRLLPGQVAGGRHRAGVDVLLLDADAHAGQLRHHVPPRPLAVVGQEPERDVPLAELLDEGVRAGDQRRTAVQNAVHVDQVAVPHNASFLPRIPPWGGGGEKEKPPGPPAASPAAGKNQVV